MPEPAPADRAAAAATLLDQAGVGAAEGGADIQIVTMKPGHAVPPLDEALRIVRRQFRTPPPGYAWRSMPLTDDAGRSCLMLHLARER